MRNSTMDSVLEDLQSAIECEEITDADDIGEWLAERCESEITNDSDALDYLKETNNDNAYWMRIGSPDQPNWTAFAIMSLEADICDEISYEDFFDEHAPGDRCESCNDRITDEDEKITNVDGDVYELCCVGVSNSGYLECGECGTAIPDNRYGATEVNGAWYCDDCVPEDEDEEEKTFSPRPPSQTTAPASSFIVPSMPTLSMGATCTICQQRIDADFDKYRASSLGGYVHLICP